MDHNSLIENNIVLSEGFGINLALSSFHERIGDRLFDAAGLWCAVRASGSGDLEQPLSYGGSADRVMVVMNSLSTEIRISSGKRSLSTMCGQRI